MHRRWLAGRLPPGFGRPHRRRRHAPTPHISAPVAVKKGPTAAELTAGMVEAASQGKSQWPVQLKFELQQRPTVGQPLEINVALDAADRREHGRTFK